MDFLWDKITEWLKEMLISGVISNLTGMFDASHAWSTDTYINGRKIVHTVKPKLGERASHNKNVIYSLDFQATPHQLRHTYITNLLYRSVDPKTVQYLAGHENSKITMDIYAKVKYNRPTELSSVVNTAFGS